MNHAVFVRVLQTKGDLPNVVARLIDSQRSITLHDIGQIVALQLEEVVTVEVEMTGPVDR